MSQAPSAPLRQRFRRALVTGASAGLGTQFARSLAAQRVDLVIVARDETRLNTLAAELRDSCQIEVEVLPADLSDPNSMAQVEERLAAHETPVDLLVNNAGVGVSGRFDLVDICDLDTMVDINIKAVMRLAYAASQQMVPRGHGAILNVSSVSTYYPAPGSNVYAATKAFVTSFSDSLQIELRDSGVTVTACFPGFTRTEIHQRSGADKTLRVPSWSWLTAEQVVEESLNGAFAGTPRVTPSHLYRFVTRTTSALPLSWKRFVMSRAAQY